MKRGTLFEQVKVLHYGVLKVISNPYMIFTPDARCQQEIRRNINEKALISSAIVIVVHLRVMKCYILSTLLYGSETWTTSGTMQKKILFKTGLYRSMNINS